MLPERPLMKLVYNLSLLMYRSAILLVSPFNAKAKKWVDGRKNWEEKITSAIGEGEKRIWFHCSSMGEFEQARPLIEAMRSEFSSYKIVVTFFSPSGYDACKDTPVADYVFYLPNDSEHNAGKFINIVQPAMAVFVKYEFWYHYLRGLKNKNIPTLLVSGAFREGQVFFKGHGGLFRDMLECFTFFFVQDEVSANMLDSIGIKNNVLVAGDTRYDRVAKIAGSTSPIPAIEQFKGQHMILIAGSTWPGDEEVLKECLPLLPPDWKLVLVPHEIDEGHIKKIQQLFDGKLVLYTELDAENTGYNKQVLVVNNMGMLSRMFAYGDIAFIGGGFQKGGIHNILEPAVFGLPVLFGPVYQKFVEAQALVSAQLVFPVNNATEAKEKLKQLIADGKYRAEISNSLKKFMQDHIGASKTIVEAIRREKWL